MKNTEHPVSNAYRWSGGGWKDVEKRIRILKEESATQMSWGKAISFFIILIDVYIIVSQLHKSSKIVFTVFLLFLVLIIYSNNKKAVNNSQINIANLEETTGYLVSSNVHYDNNSLSYQILDSDLILKFNDVSIGNKKKIAVRILYDPKSKYVLGTKRMKF